MASADRLDFWGGYSATEYAFFFQCNDTKVQCFMSLFIIRTVLYSLDASH